MALFEIIDLNTKIVVLALKMMAVLVFDKDNINMKIVLIE